MKKWLKNTLIIGGSIIGGLLALWGGANLVKAIAYSDYYRLTKFDGKIPGLNDGAVQQGVTVDSFGNYIVATYMQNGKDPSRIYIKDSEQKVRYVELYEDDLFQVPCVRHCGGIQYVEATGKLYLADATKFVIPLDYLEVMTCEKVSIQGLSQRVNNEASFVYSDENYVYVGEFNKEGTNWLASNKITHNNVTHKSICSRYPIVSGTVNFNEPDVIYSICDLVQGIAFVDTKMYVSTSYGISSSHLKVYDLLEAERVADYQETETYFVDRVENDLKMPPMSEDLDVNKDGRIVSISESASNKYIFGKLLFLDEISLIKF